ncbi:MAG: hypothetical protein LBH05_04820 [Deferribacteraceae bacterium]|nr:hypothetical protein [Deferribacteraceae bacterium]
MCSLKVLIILFALTFTANANDFYRDPNTKCQSHFTIGSSKQLVIAIHGIPVVFDKYYIMYDYGSVYFDISERVAGYNNFGKKLCIKTEE